MLTQSSTDNDKTTVGGILMTSTREHSNAQEEQVANVLNGKKVANSGATPFNKADVVTEHFAIECKTRMKRMKSTSIKKEWIDGIKEEAFAMGLQQWAIAFNFGDSLNNAENFYIISEDMIKYLTEKLEEEM